MIIHPTNRVWPGGSVIDTPQEAYADGYIRGAHWARQGEFYQAGGPFVGTGDRPGFSALYAAAKLANEAFRAGWAAGQAAVKADLKAEAEGQY